MSSETIAWIILFSIAFYYLSNILKNQIKMGTQNDAIKESLDAINATLDNIAQDNTEQTALIEELKTKLESDGVSKENMDLLDAIKQKATSIAGRWPNQPETGGDETGG